MASPDRPGDLRPSGRSHALRLAQEGADIVAVDLLERIATIDYPVSTKEDLDETVRQIQALDRWIVAQKAGALGSVPASRGGCRTYRGRSRPR